MSQGYGHLGRPMFFSGRRVGYLDRSWSRNPNSQDEREFDWHISQMRQKAKAFDRNYGTPDLDITKLEEMFKDSSEKRPTRRKGLNEETSSCNLKVNNAAVDLSTSLSLEPFSMPSSFISEANKSAASAQLFETTSTASAAPASKIVHLSKSSKQRSAAAPDSVNSSKRRTRLSEKNTNSDVTQAQVLMPAPSLVPPKLHGSDSKKQFSSIKLAISKGPPSASPAVSFAVKSVNHRDISTSEEQAIQSVNSAASALNLDDSSDIFGTVRQTEAEGVNITVNNSEPVNFTRTVPFATAGQLHRSRLPTVITTSTPIHGKGNVEQFRGLRGPVTSPIGVPRKREIIEEPSETDFNRSITVNVAQRSAGAVPRLARKSTTATSSSWATFDGLTPSSNDDQFVTKSAAAVKSISASQRKESAKIASTSQNRNNSHKSVTEAVVNTNEQENNINDTSLISRVRSRISLGYTRARFCSIAPDTETSGSSEGHLPGPCGGRTSKEVASKKPQMQASKVADEIERNQPNNEPRPSSDTEDDEQIDKSTVSAETEHIVGEGSDAGATSPKNQSPLVPFETASLLRSRSILKRRRVLKIEGTPVSALKKGESAKKSRRKSVSFSTAANRKRQYDAANESAEQSSPSSAPPVKALSFFKDNMIFTPELGRSLPYSTSESLKHFAEITETNSANVEQKDSGYGGHCSNDITFLPSPRLIYPSTPKPPGVRRSKRVRIPRLRHEFGERARYILDKDCNKVFAGIEKGVVRDKRYVGYLQMLEEANTKERDRYKASRSRPTKGKALRRGRPDKKVAVRDIDAELEIAKEAKASLPTDFNEADYEDLDVLAEFLDINGKIVRRKPFTRSLEKTGHLKVAQNDDFAVAFVSESSCCRIFEMIVLALGQTEDVSSPFERKFKVEYGKLLFTLGEVSKILQTGDWIDVPSYTLYNLRNLRVDEAKLTFIEVLHKPKRH